MFSVRIDGVSRSAYPLAWPVCPAKGAAAPTHTPAPVNPEYAEFVADQAREREIERFTYADLVRARQAAIREARRTAEGEMVGQPAQVAKPAPSEAPACRHDCDHAHVDVAERSARAEFRRLVETVDNRGSLIDLLL